MRCSDRNKPLATEQISQERRQLRRMPEEDWRGFRKSSESAMTPFLVVMEARREEKTAISGPAVAMEEENPQWKQEELQFWESNKKKKPWMLC